MNTYNMYNVGDRIELVRMANDPDPVPNGTRGTISFVSYLPTWNQTSISVRWDNGRSLSVLLPIDLIRKIENK